MIASQGMCLFKGGMWSRTSVSMIAGRDVALAARVTPGTQFDHAAPGPSDRAPQYVSYCRGSHRGGHPQGYARSGSAGMSDDGPGCTSCQGGARSDTTPP